jgi:hypothetical protein
MGTWGGVAEDGRGGAGARGGAVEDGGGSPQRRVVVTLMGTEARDGLLDPMEMLT